MNFKAIKIAAVDVYLRIKDGQMLKKKSMT
jgi:hypothetical protein